MRQPDLLAMVGRVLLAALFLCSAFGRVTRFDETVRLVEERALPAAPVLAGLAVVIETMGGLSLVLGFRTRWAAAALSGFVLAAGLVFHGGAGGRVQLLENLAIVGGLLQVLAHGPGAMALDGRDRLGA